MIDLSFDPVAGTARLVSTTVIKAGASVPLRISFTTAPGSATALYFALVTDAAPPVVQAFTDVFTTVSDTVMTATLDATDSRLVAFLTGKASVALKAEFGGTFGGVRQIAPNLDVTVQAPGVTGPATSMGGPSYYTTGQADSAIATAVAAALSAALGNYAPRIVTGKYRIKSDGSVELWNADQSKFHALGISGAAGAETLTMGAGES